MFNNPLRLTLANDLPKISHPSVYMGDLNTPHTLRICERHQNDEYDFNWALNNGLHIIVCKFYSRRWNSNYNLDLCFVSTGSEIIALTASRSVFRSFPRSQHRILEVGIQLPVINSKEYMEF